MSAASGSREVLQVDRWCFREKGLSLDLIVGLLLVAASIEEELLVHYQDALTRYCSFCNMAYKLIGSERSNLTTSKAYGAFVCYSSPRSLLVGCGGCISC